MNTINNINILLLADSYINQDNQDELTIEEFDSILSYYLIPIKIDKRSLPETQMKRKATLLERYGVDSLINVRHLKKKKKVK